MIALCAILLLAPEGRSQDIQIRKKMLTISGKIGVGGVSLTGLPGNPPPQTDENGVYSVEVEYGWSGKVTPVKNGYTFMPSEKVYPKVTTHQSDQDYLAELKTYTISGSVGQPGVRLSGFPTEVVSGPDGRYKATVDWGFTLTIVPDKTGFTFDPPTMTYNQVRQNYEQNFQAKETKFTISGTVGEPGVRLNGFPGEVVSGQDGRYSTQVRYGTTNLKIVPIKGGCVFTPEYQEYPLVVDDYPSQDYGVEVLTYQISGSAGQPGVTMKGLPGDPMTNDLGYYQAVVPWGWTATVTPDKAGYTFSPPSKPYKNVTADYENENYNPEQILLRIEGSTGIGEVTLTGFPGSATVSDGQGKYSVQVEYGWTGQVTPQKDGYLFTPTEKIFPPVTAPLTNQNFKHEKLTFEISGSIQPALPGVKLTGQGLSAPILVGADGSYKLKVDYGWDGTLTPTKAGYSFEPSEYSYVDVIQSLPNQNFLGRIVQRTISGKVTLKDGTPVPDVQIVPEGTSPAVAVVTDSTGAFEISVDHGWSGKVTPRSEAWVFTPPVKPFPTVSADMPNQGFSAEQRMMTISNIVKYNGTEPIQGMQVTATPGGYSATSDVTGRWTVKVPYGWTGELSFFKEDLDIEGTVAYPPVTEDIDPTAQKKPVAPPSTRPPTTAPDTRPPTTAPDTRPPTTAPDTRPPTTAPDTRPPTTVPDTRPPTTAPDTRPPTTSDVMTPKALLQQQLDRIKKEMDALPVEASSETRMNELLAQYSRVFAMIEGTAPVDTRIIGPGPLPDGTTYSPSAATPKLLSVLEELSKLTNTRIGVDLTVKDEPIAEGAASVQNLPVDMALRRILAGASKEYTFKRQPDGTYLVFHPLSITFAGGEIRQALEMMATQTEVPIIPDPNVSGDTSASFENMHLEGALSRILAGTPFVFKRIEDYYLVADRSPDGPAFHEISVTSYVRTSHTLPVKIKDLLPPQYHRYVQAEVPSVTDANDLGHLLTISAPQKISDAIMDMIRNLDRSPRQVLLDARVVVMERGNMLNLGVEWRFPTAQLGWYYDPVDKMTRGLQIGYSPDQTFTNSLMATLNLLQANNQADIVTHQQLVAEHGSQAQLRSIQEEWFMMSDQQNASGQFGVYSRAELQKVESGTTLTITPYIGDSNEIKLRMAVEVSDSIPRGPDSDLPIVTRRQAKNAVTVQNGGTVAVAGLTETRGRNVEKRVPFLGSLPGVGGLFRNKDDQKSTREVAVFVTATLVESNSSTAIGGRPAGPAIGVAPSGVRSQPQAAQRMTQQDLADALRRTQ